jgi:hypothetical protein
VLAGISAHDIPNGVIVAGAVVAALGAIWQKVVKPVRGFASGFKAWMDRIETTTSWVESQMKPNGGGSLVDKVNLLLKHDAERDKEGKRYGTTDDET